MADWPQHRNIYKWAGRRFLISTTHHRVFISVWWPSPVSRPHRDRSSSLQCPRGRRRLDSFQQPPSCHGVSKGLSHSLNWRHVKTKGRRESPGRSLSSRESLLIMCGRGLLGHLHSCGPVAGPCLWTIWARPAELVWWNERWCVSEGAISSLAKGLNLLDLIREGPSGRCRVVSQTNWMSWPVGISLWSLVCALQSSLLEVQS